jgi:hypothetical protein
MVRRQWRRVIIQPIKAFGEGFYKIHRKVIVMIVDDVDRYPS